MNILASKVEVRFDLKSLHSFTCDSIEHIVYRWALEFLSVRSLYAQKLKLTYEMNVAFGSRYTS